MKQRRHKPVECIDCHRSKPFPAHAGRRHICIDCARARAVEYRQRNPSKAAENGKRWRAERSELYRKSYECANLKKYGLTPEKLADLTSRQNGLCKICGDPPSPAFKGKLFVDHDHTTGRVRGLLCGPCNCALGHFKENEGIIRKAAEYLSRARAKVTEMPGPDIAKSA